MRKKAIQTGFILVIIGIFIIPASKHVSLATQAAADGGGTTLWTHTSPTDGIYVGAIGDFNGDGRDDVLTGSDSGDVYALNGATGEPLWNYSAPTAPISAMAVGDFNGDGVDDALAGCQDSNIYAINGTNGGLWWNYSTPTDQIGELVVGDFNSDGMDDVFAEAIDNTVYAINGTNNVTLWNYTHSWWSIIAAAVGDFYGDGVDDILTGCQDSNVYALNGTTGQPLWNYSAPGVPMLSVAVGDFNGDGVDDALAGSGGGSATVYAIDGVTNGTLLWTYPTLTGFVYSLAVGDFNGDGRDDALAGTVASRVHAIAGTTGRALWTYSSPIRTGTNGSMDTVAVGDFNGDGIDDALAKCRDRNIYTLDGATGQLLWIYSTPIGSVTVGDFNGDGVDDFAGSYGTTIYAIAGAAPPPTKLEVQLTVSKTYVNLTNDWTIARAVVTNVGAFPAYSVSVICHAPDGIDNATFYKQIQPSHSMTTTWKLTSGDGLPTVKNPDDAIEISYTIAVEVVAANCPTELVEVALIVDPPVESSQNPLLLAGIFGVPPSLGVAVLVWYRKRRRKF